MNRRNFLRTTALGSVCITTSGMYLMGKESIKCGEISLEKANMKIPVISDVDVVIIGGATAGVAAAVEVSKSGKNAFLICEETYLGYDVTATYRYWPYKDDETKSELFQKTFPKSTIPTPLHVKKVLDDALIENEVGFFFSSYLYDIIFDYNNNIAGVIIANRSGLQVVKAKVLIDATQNAKAVKMAGAEFYPFKKSMQNFEFTVVGNNKKSVSGLVVTEISELIKVEENEYKALKYNYKTELKENTYSAIAKIEQEIRDIVWDPEQFDSSDMLFYIPENSIISKEKSKLKSFELKKISIDSFIPKGYNNLFVLNSYAEIDRELVSSLLQTNNYMLIGEKIGKEAAKLSDTLQPSVEFKSGNSKAKIQISDEIHMSSDFVRQSIVKGEISASLDSLPILGEYDVVVMGGGTAGAPAGIGAARKGAKTLVIEYLHGLGGEMTMGLIGSYFFGYREGFTKEIDKGVAEIGIGSDRKERQHKGQWVKDWKIEWFRKELRQAGADIWYGVIGIGAVLKDNSVKGIVVATPFGKGVVLAKNIVDSTGSADIAIAAGSKFRYTDKNSVAIQGAGLPPIRPETSYSNTDWTFINDSDVFDIWRTFVAAKKKYKDNYDIGKLLQTRERRRIIGEYEIEVLDVFNGKEYNDTFSRHHSSFDTHGFTIDPFFILKPPGGDHTLVYADVPFRALLPKGLENIIVTGLGASAHRDCMPVIRMQPCLQNQGYAAGMAVALTAKNNVSITQLDIKSFQKELVSIGNLPEEVLTSEDTKMPDEKKIKTAVNNVVDNLNELEIVLWNKDISVPLMQAKLKEDISDEQKIVYARILAIHGFGDGWYFLNNLLKNTDKWDEGWRYKGMGQFGQSMSYLDSIIMALGKTKVKDTADTIIKLAVKLTPESELSHFRVVSEAFINLHTLECKEILYKLLQLYGVQGHDVPTIEKAEEIVDDNWTDTSTRNDALREIFLAKGLYKCGDKNGLGKSILVKYSKDLRGHFVRHAGGILEDA